MAANPFDPTTILPLIKTPLILAGLVILVLFYLYRGRLNTVQSVLIFVLALVAICLGIYAWWYDRHPPPPISRTIDGHVYSPPDQPGSGVFNVTLELYIHNQAPSIGSTDPNGHYTINIPNVGNNATGDLVVKAAGYRPVYKKNVSLDNVSEWNEIGLEAIPKESASAPLPAQIVQRPNQNPEIVPQQPLQLAASCLNGIWREHLIGTPDTNQMFTWTMENDGDKLSAKRSDGFASGIFVKTGVDWKGDLNWGNKDVWHNVTLTPSADCKLISTNQGWTYGR